jgi:hypothetical protein
MFCLLVRIQEVEKKYYADGEDAYSMRKSLTEAVPAAELAVNATLIN